MSSWLIITPFFSKGSNDNSLSWLKSFLGWWSSVNSSIDLIFNWNSNQAIAIPLLFYSSIDLIIQCVEISSILWFGVEITYWAAEIHVCRVRENFQLPVNIFKCCCSTSNGANDAHQSIIQRLRLMFIRNYIANLVKKRTYN